MDIQCLKEYQVISIKNFHEASLEDRVKINECIEKSYLHNFLEALDNGEIVESLVSQQELEQAELQSMLVNDKLEIASDWLEFNN